MESMFVWKVDVNKMGDGNVYESLYFLAPNFFNLSHVVAIYVFGDEETDGMYPDFQVEVTGMSRVPGVGKIVNANLEFDDDGEEVDLEAPLDLSHANADLTAEFKCSCNNKVKTNMGIDWNVTRCPHCQRIILRRDLSEIGSTGVWAYTPSNGAGK